MEHLETLQNMLNKASSGSVNLEIEVLISLINNIADDDLDLAKECENALNEWDI